MANNFKMALRPGTTIRGKVYTYQIQKVLGQGGFGITYLASTSVTGPLGAIKVQVALKEFFAKDLDSRDADGAVAERTEGGIASKYAKAFQRESENLSKMKAPGIVNVLEAFQANGTYYYSMEYLPGGSLDDKVKGHGLPESEALPLFKKVCEAVSFMHGKKMMHLDIKPKNIMLDGEGNPILIDFGLSKQYDENGEPESSTTIGAGTPGYAPIEQAAPHAGNVFQAGIDIYALGATLYKMLTGTAPLTAPEILNGRFPEEPLRLKSVSQDVIDLIRKAMAMRQKDRYSDVAALLQAVPQPDKDDEDITVVKEVEPDTVPDPEPDTVPDPEPDSEPDTVPPTGPGIYDGQKRMIHPVVKVVLWAVLLICVATALVFASRYAYLEPSRILFFVAAFFEVVGLGVLLYKRRWGFWVFAAGCLAQGATLVPEGYARLFILAWFGGLLLITGLALFCKVGARPSAWRLMK